MGRAQTIEEMSASRTNDDKELETVVMLAARGGDTDMLHAVLQSVQKTLTNQQVGLVCVR